MVVIHIRPAEGGWAVRNGRSAPATIHPTPAQAVAAAWELAGARAAEVIVHGADGSIAQSLSIRDYTSMAEDDEVEDQELRRLAERITPRNEQLDALIARMPFSSVVYNDEDDELPC